MFPKGMFVDNIVEVAKKELAWEVNYTREAECTHRFKQLLAPYPEYLVPEVIGSYDIFTFPPCCLPFCLQCLGSDKHAFVPLR